jgi:hypothetical protein
MRKDLEFELASCSPAFANHEVEASTHAASATCVMR